MLRGTKRKRRPALGCQDVDTAAKVHAIFVRSPPRTLGDVYHAGQDARGDAGGDDQFPAIVPDADEVAIVDAPFSCVDGVDEDALGEGFAQPVVVVVGGVDTSQGVVAEGLQRRFNDVIARPFFARSNLLGCQVYPVKEEIATSGCRPPVSG